MSVTAPWRIALCAGAFSACVAVAPVSVGLAGLIAVAVCVVIAVVFAELRTVTALVALVACVLGTWRGLGAATVDRGPASVAGHLGNGALVLRGTVGDAGVPGREDTIVVDVRDLATQAGAWRVSGAVVVEPRTAVAVLPGDIVDVQTNSLRAPPQRPGSLSAVALERVGVTAIATAAQVTVLVQGGPAPARVAQRLRRLLAAAVARALPEPAATLLLGVAFGIHGRLAGVVRTPLQDAGLIHIVAVSGLKVVMVAGLIQSLARLRGWSRRRRTVATLATIGAYVVLSGAGAAALRSSLMVSAGLLLSRDGRRPHSFALLGLCAGVLLAVEPAVATDVGFQLSFLGTAGILLLASPIADRLPGPRLLVEPFAVTVAAQLATTPITAGTFGVLSLVGPFANALVLPLLPLVIVAGGAGALLSTVAPALGWAPLEMAALVCRVILAIAQGASALPFAAIAVQLWPSAWTLAELGAGGAGALAWYLHDRWLPFRAGSVAIGVTVALVAGVVSTWAAVAATGHALRVTVLDVGNGVAVLIRAPGGGLVLVDGGSDGAALLTALGRVLSPLDRHLDAVVLTATDRSTSAGIPSLIGHYDVGSLLVSQPLPPALQTAATLMAGTGTRVVAAGASPWTVGGTSVRCIASGPLPAAPCVLQLTDGHATALVTGTLPQLAQDEIAGVAGTQLRADLLVAPVTSAPSAALIGVVHPQLVAVPAKRAPPGLAGFGLEVALTGRDSDIEYVAVASGGFTTNAG
ncbi:MAG: ComEC/Rec2 family competence protein [Candidatus Dormibacteraeota bacterium]|uniref:ComEC/Rec2 family competence protein n=1 Tax=Candidatus Amunia macphersoniae TaxID=3127014 RepID=A0A934KAK9_9BACT|nr:ComEC/Rec2 family competence protein [Candidatus Dormibacteraeota bacterium]